MFNRSYQVRAVRLAGGGHKAAADSALRLPWAGIFEPWRPFVLVAKAARTKNVRVRPKNVLVRAQVAANRCKKGSGRLQGVQLDLFPDIAAQKFTAGENLHAPVKNSAPESGLLNFPPLAGVEVPITDEDRPLFDLFPDAYL